jgi:hypothetical protein
MNQTIKTLFLAMMLLQPLFALADCELDCLNAADCSLVPNGGYCEISKNACLSACKSRSTKSYGALAYDKTSGAFGWSDKWESKEKAEKVAIANCSKHGSNCESLIWFYNNCGAIAADGAILGWARSDAQATAEKDALTNCKNEGGANCKIKVAHCSK